MRSASAPKSSAETDCAPVTISRVFATAIGCSNISFCM
jgi:hypothetical protein